MSEPRDVYQFPESAARSEEHRIFSPQQDLGPGNRYLTEVMESDDDYCLLLCTLPPGVVVPLHGHGDRETFYVVSGTPDAFRGDHWETLAPGDVFDARNGLRHAWRNSTATTVTMLCTTTMRMARFLRDIALDRRGTDPQTEAQRFLTLVERHGYWIAAPGENAAIGLSANWGASLAQAHLRATPE